MNYNVDLPAQLPMESTGEFFIQPLPDVWKEILLERLPLVMDVLENSNTYLAGGLLRTLISDEPLSSDKTDIDLFFNSDHTYQAVKTHLSLLDGFEKVFQCPEDKLVTFIDTHTGWKYQCIAVSFYPTPLDVVSSFDFTTACLGTDGKVLVFHKYAIIDTMETTLRWNKITHPASSLRRMMKYARKGFAMPGSEYQYFVEQVASHSPDIEDFEMVYVD